MTDRVLILDFGSQVTQLIARRLREIGVYCEIHPFNKVTEATLKAYGPKAIILYGFQAMCQQLGGEVQSSDHQEFGRAYVEVTGDSVLWDGVWKKGERQQ